MLLKRLCTGRVTTALLMFLVFVAASLIALGFPDKARLIPLLIGVSGAVLGFVQLVVEVRACARLAAADAATADDPEADPGLRAAEFDMFIWILLFFFVILGFGFIYASPVLVFAFLLVGKRESLLVATTCAVGIWASLYGGFELGFGLPLFKGLIFEWLGG